MVLAVPKHLPTVLWKAGQEQAGQEQASQEPGSKQNCLLLEHKSPRTYRCLKFGSLLIPPYNLPQALKCHCPVSASLLHML